MGVDHGLGGRDNKKSREKRDRRFRKKQAKAQLLQKLPAKKRAVVFDEEARVEYVTGFRKRKKERRQFGIAMQVLKDKKTLRDKKPKFGKMLQAQELLEVEDVSENSANENESSQELIDNAGDSNDNNNQVENEVKFDDEGTTSMFGGEVSVTIDTNIAEKLDEASYVFSGSTKKLHKAPSALEKALKKAKSIMHLKTINKNKHVHIKKGDKTGGKMGSKTGVKGGKKSSKR